MRVGVVGINHKLAHLALREQLAKACQKWFGPIRAVQGDHSFVLLSTCNRTEIYFSSQELTDTHVYLLEILRSEIAEEFEHRMYSFFGVDCFSHLARVTLGLDSAVVAETEIQGQVKQAYESTAEHHTLPKELHFLFQKSLGIAKRIRSKFAFERGDLNVEHAVLISGKQIFDNPKEARVLFVGASEINQKIISFFKMKNFKNMTLCNRSSDQANIIAQKYGLFVLPWSTLSSWQDYDWIIFGTKSQSYLVESQELLSCVEVKNKLIIDLSVPRNVEPTVGLHEGITLHNIDHINRLLRDRRKGMMHILKHADECVSQATKEHAARWVCSSEVGLLANN